MVPVGADQQQHIEFTRDTAEKFNHIFGETFKLPEPLILSEVETVPGIDGQKMSKSYNNTIPLFGEDEEIRKAVMSIVTDSKDPTEPKDPDTCNIYALHKLFSKENLVEIEKGGTQLAQTDTQFSVALPCSLRPSVSFWRGRR